ncbi:PREDICTED: phosphatidylinositol N-acetylglucosaminyltransferase subunit Q [Dinoponera quadriceps]|uniref:Phosphatidylinositol N-acetylglucosaminyltransferase subunit Q n=1 Tax=Dinoponera quadriceps TaxID=609295 RepID=A0A6P3YE57_DINQU|nr:PREDICTED: phosphatidylinositol N-acetylglucosaminyltransferase subunit Q [Dinoponera quadriceps]
MTNNLLVFIPQGLHTKQSGFVFGKVIHDTHNNMKRMYIIGLRKVGSLESTKCTLDTIGCYTNSSNVTKEFLDRKHSDWIHITGRSSGNKARTEYHLTNIILNNVSVDLSTTRTIIVLYDQQALQETELFKSKAVSGDHFYELAKLIQSKKDELKVKTRFTRVKETLLTYHMLFYLYPVLLLSKVTEKLLLVLKYSSLGLHVHDWLENIKWMLVTVIRNKGFTLKTGNYAWAMIIDVALGIFVLRLLQYRIEDTLSSQLLLNNAEKVVETLKDLINWLMGVPAGLKLNHALNNTMGKFFMYHIQLWWTFLIFSKPLMDLAFKILLLFGKLGVTFQLSIAADLLSLVSFHTYCIYVYAARLYNIQLRGITALFRLFLGKKKNPLRERVDSCQYQTDQLFVGTLSFTILVFLMPTTWVYYTVFTLLRLISIGFGGLLTRLKFYLQVMPVYTLWQWLLRSYSICNTVDVRLHPICPEKPTTLSMTLVIAPWSHTWKKCVPDTITCHPSIEWRTILNNIMWGQLLYPL